MNQQHIKRNFLNSKAFFILTLLSLITACGGGSSNSGGNKKVRDCLERINGSAIPLRSTLRNICPFAINAKSAIGDERVFNFPANTTLTINTLLFVPGVCRAPSVPIEVTTEGFKCS